MIVVAMVVCFPMTGSGLVRPNPDVRHRKCRHVVEELTLDRGRDILRRAHGRDAVDCHVEVGGEAVPEPAGVQVEDLAHAIDVLGG